ncbi:hypothetical protein BDE02_18G123200 [Populus trichocarpa]|nr:hypothetical protein BDE02_18G123200 [Populus trichocarpa]KAI5557731.1 hypothetical protein BDE02_18G123200 [Populus trichocarpa]
MICVNFDAGYGCFTPEARKSPVKIVVVGICVALGVLFLLYKVVKKSKGIDKLKKKFFKQDYDLLLQEGLSLAEVDVEEMMSDVEEADPTI